jgi:14-3-3 protein epsilon
MTDPADLFFYADALVKASRFSEAITFVEKLIAVKPSLGVEECSLFEKAFKLRIDPIRRTLLTLSAFYGNAVEEGQVQRAELIERYRERANAELTTLCHRAVDVLKCSLLPNAESPKARVFFYKLLGDHWRYLAEHSAGRDHQTAMTEAEEHYKREIEIADEALLKSNPLRLGVILHYAIFKFDHAKALSEAVDLAQKARSDAEIDLAQLSVAEQSEALEVLSAMRANLATWFDEGDVAGRE